MRRFRCNQHPLFRSKNLKRRSELSVTRLEISERTTLVVSEVCDGLAQSFFFHCAGVRAYGFGFLFYLWVKFDNGVNYCVVDFDSAWREDVVWYIGYDD